MNETQKIPKHNIFDIEQLGLYISKGIHYNVKPCHVYGLDGEGVEELPGVNVINSNQAVSNESPVAEVEFENSKLTGRGWLAVAGFSAIATSFVAYFIK